MNNNGPQIKVSRTGSSMKGWQWACGYATGAAAQIVDGLGKAYTGEARNECYGSTKLRAIKAFEARYGWAVAA